MQRIPFGQSDKNRPLVLAMGLFDAVHLGHAALLKQTVALAKESGAVPAVFTLSGCKGTPLFTEDERATFLSRLGIELMIVAPFAEVKDTAGRDFLSLLFDQFSISAVTCGEDYRFGSGAQCGEKDLREFCASRGVGLTVVPDITDRNGKRISTTAVKEALSAGDLLTVKALLGREYSVQGRVQTGYKIGRTLGFPTANVDLSGRFLPKAGVYAVRSVLEEKSVGAFAAEKLPSVKTDPSKTPSAEDRLVPSAENSQIPSTKGFTAGSAAEEAEMSGAVFYGIANVGAAPTVGHDNVLLEVHYDGFSADLYGKTVVVEFLAYIREIKKFQSKEELSVQLSHDKERLHAIVSALFR